MEFRLLGPLDVRRDGKPVALSGRRQRALLALLLLHGNAVVPVDRLVDELWGDDPPASAGNALQVQVHGLRRALGTDRVETHGRGYLLRTEAGEVDLDTWEELCDRARREPPRAAARTLRRALALWRGGALAGVEARFVVREADRLEESRLTALEERIEAELEAGEGDGLVAELEALVAEHPFRERLHRQLMLALYRGGRQADALAAYRRARATLVDELGLEPGPELQALEAAILRQDEELAPPVADGAGATPRLPVAARPLVGRRLELAATTALLRRPDVRLLTLTGPGGTGKSRLALAAAAGVELEQADGAATVDLSAVDDPALVRATVARALGLDDAADLAAWLRERELLLLVDNFEHVADAAPLLGELLAAAPLLTVLATSRTPLRLAAEREYPVEPLPLPEPGSTVEAVAANDAVALFVERARAVEPSFALSADNAASVADVCIALDGLPLALELAAARVKTMSPAGILGRLERRLDLLTSATRDVPERQRTLRAAIDWSHDLLAPAEQALFARLAVFEDGCSLADAEAVCGASPDGMAALVDASLVQPRPGAGGEPRFRLLDTIREYAGERLAAAGEGERLRERHAERFLAFAVEQSPLLLTAEGAGLVARFEEEYANVRAALTTSRATRPDDHLRACAALWRFWYLRGHLVEGRSWLAGALAAQGMPADRADALKAASILAAESGDADEARRHADEALDLYRGLGDDRGVLSTLTVLGRVHRTRGDIVAARAAFEESGALARALGREEDVAVALVNLAAVAADERDDEQVSALVEEAVPLLRRVGRTDSLAVALEIRGVSELRSGRLDDAEQTLEEALELARTLDFTAVAAACLVALASAANERGESERAARLLGAAGAAAAEAEAGVEPVDPAWVAETTAAVRSRLADAEFAARFAEGRARPLEETLRG